MMNGSGNSENTCRICTFRIETNRNIWQEGNPEFRVGKAYIRRGKWRSRLRIPPLPEKAFGDMNRSMAYQIIDHTADFGLRVTAPDLPALFAEAVSALFDVLVEVRVPADATETLTLQISGDDWADLMINWLREALYQWTGEERVVRGTEILSLSAHSLTARLFHEPYDPDRHVVLQEIKAVTYHLIRVAPAPSGWEARIIFDI